MRIIAGSNRGLRLRGPRSQAIRPTSDRVREALFAILQPWVVEASFLDVFAGTGGVGLEALSRGAREAVFLEQSPVALRILRENIALTGSGPRAVVLAGPVARTLPRLARGGCPSFDLVYVDPPYFQDLLPAVFSGLVQLGLLAPGAVVIAETSSREPPVESLAELRLVRRSVYGDTSLNFYKQAGG